MSGIKVDVAIIGGTGVGDRLLRYGGSPIVVPTRDGLFRGRVIEHEGVSICLVSRHSAGHKLPAHRVNYHAIALGLKALGAKGCFASAAVGSIRTDWRPGTLVVCSDYLDLTYRNTTLYDREVAHTDFTDPFGPKARAELLGAASDVGAPHEDGGVYVCLNGPRYETPHEIEVYKQLGGHLVGMTAASEAILMREAGIDYATLAVVTNAAAGYSEQPLSHQEVEDEMERTGETAVQILLRAAVRLAKAG
jgi:5'-methylthioadenosine phosphorylase